jgi:hypothetical protein
VVVSAESIYPTNNQDVACPEDIEQPLPLWPIRKPSAHPGNAVVGHHFIEAEARRLRLFALVGQGLIGRANPGVKDRSVAAATLCLVRWGDARWVGCPQGENHPSGLVFGRIFGVHEAIPLRTIQKWKSGSDKWGDAKNSQW